MSNILRVLLIASIVILCGTVLIFLIYLSVYLHSRQQRRRRRHRQHGELDVPSGDVRLRPNPVSLGNEAGEQPLSHDDAEKRTVGETLERRSTIIGDLIRRTLNLAQTAEKLADEQEKRLSVEEQYSLEIQLRKKDELF